MDATRIASRLPTPSRLLSIFAIALVLAGADFATAEVFRCTVDGKTVYSDKPCGGTETRLRIDKGQGEERFVQSLQHEANMGRVAVGQTHEQVVEAWGEPAARNIDMASTEGDEEWVYTQPTGRASVHFRRGMVSSFVVPEPVKPPETRRLSPPLRGPTKVGSP